MNSGDGLPPGQVWGKKFIIYAALGIPRVAAESWTLKVDGLVRSPQELTYEQLTAGRLIRYTKSFHCLLPNGFVYTDHQPMNIADIGEGTKVVGIDGQVHSVSRVIKRRHTGQIIGIKAAYLPAERMTPDHPVWVVPGHPGYGKTRSKRRLLTFSSGWRPVWKRADNVKVGDYVYFPKYRHVSDAKFVQFRNQTYPVDEKLASLVGWYVAEGSGASSDDRTIAFSLNSEEKKDGSHIKSLLEEMFNARVGTYTNSRGTLLKLVATRSDVACLHQMLAEWCGRDAPSKRIPDFIMNAAPSILKSFLTCYLRGDGYVKEVVGGKRAGLIDFTTSSKVLAYQLLLALSKLEIPGELVSHPGSVRMGFSVRVKGEMVRRLLPRFKTYRGVDRSHYKETADGFYYPVTRVWRSRYDGIVYDFQAPPSFTMLSPFATQDCVTQWSIKDVEWEGVQFRSLVEPAGVDPKAKWVMLHCLDGYRTPIPIDDAMADDAIVAFKVNGKALSAEQGFPARPFFPNLYGWKSAKWLSRVEFVERYSDGYWETYGYHERANVWEEERFKGHVGKHSKKTAYGTA